MGAILLKVEKRETGKQSAKQVRNSGKVTGVYYFKGQEPIPIQAEVLDMRPIVYTGATRIINLDMEGFDEPRECVLKDVSFDPVTDQIVHFDLMGIKRGEKMQVRVPVRLVGQPEGERLGGLVQHIIRKVRVKCLPKHLPEQIDIEVTHLNIGDSVTLADGNLENLEFEIPLDSVVCSVVPPRVIEEPTVAAEEGAEVEGEEAEGEEAQAAEETKAEE